MGAADRMRWSRRLAFACLAAAACDRSNVSPGEKLARTYCSACHEFPEPKLLDKRAWEQGVLPQMAPRVGVSATSLAAVMSRSPYMPVLGARVSSEDWGKIVEYFRDNAPDSLPYQSLPAEPGIDPPFFAVSALSPTLRSSGVITLLKVDSSHRRIFIGEAGSNTLRVLDWNRRLVASLRLESAPTDLIVDHDRVLVLESGILDPNDEAKGTLREYALSAHDSLELRSTLIDSLFRPVSVQRVPLDGTGRPGFIICEFGNNRGRLAYYSSDGSHYVRHVLDATPGAIRVELHDMNADGHPDIVALFGQGDERIVVYQNDGTGNFTTPRILARFPPVYGSMFFSMRDFNGDGKLDILYVNGDNFDYSRVLKPYHGVRILENDGSGSFRERYFFPVYGAARAEVADFDGDGRPDILVTSNFADFNRHPERGIVFLRNAGAYQFRPYAFSIAATNQWNLTATADLDGDGRPDVLVGAMDLRNIGYLQRGSGAPAVNNPILLFENK
ncbi:MAG TPA: FG-GAP-like repeat-containing protein, partial [Gemmatimonadaceae bacterium]|nr:FG-GAP-like repeat-containing protein [Gemmatimonadaceae bacterium]